MIKTATISINMQISGNFLIELASRVRAIHIHQRPHVQANILVDNYFFGVTNGNRAPIFAGLFEKKLEKLYISNVYRFLDEESGFQLMQASFQSYTQRYV